MMKTSIRFLSMRSIRASRVCALLALAGALLGVTAPARCADSTWVATGSLNLARAGHAAALLPDGKVLVAGGAGTSAELYDPRPANGRLRARLARLVSVPQRNY